MRASEIRALTDEQIKKELEDTYRELMNLRFRLATLQLSNVNMMRNTRKKIAQIKTILTERELAGHLQ